MLISFMWECNDPEEYMTLEHWKQFSKHKAAVLHGSSTQNYNSSVAHFLNDSAFMFWTPKAFIL